MIQELCRRLKEKRSELGYSIEYVVEKTKLHPSVIRDIENEQLHNISVAYLRGFVKIYAVFLEVDVGTALEEIDALKEASQKAKLVKKAERPFKKEEPVSTQHIEKTPKETPVKTKKYVIGALAIICIVWVFFMVGKFLARSVRTFRSSPRQEEPVKKTEAVGLIEENTELLVSLTAKKKCFIRVVVDHKLMFEGVIETGALESWRADKEVEFKISDGSAVYLEVNGKPIPTLTSIRKPIKSLKITPSEISVDK